MQVCQSLSVSHLLKNAAPHINCNEVQFQNSQVHCYALT